jgi:hypothetical protein
LVIGFPVIIAFFVIWFIFKNVLPKKEAKK